MTDEPMTDEIAPCPACDGTATMHRVLSGVWINCDNSRCLLSGPQSDSERQAIAAWNTLSAAATLAKAARAWLAEVERVDPLPSDQCVFGGVTVGMIRGAAAEKENGND